MELLKKLKKPVIKERKLCYIVADNEFMDEFNALDLGRYVIICDITDMRCWQVPKPLLNRFLKELFEGYKEIRLSC